MFAPSQSKNQQVDISVVNMLQYFGVRLSKTDEGMLFADLICVLRHDRFDCLVEMLPNSTNVLWITDFA